MKKLAAVIIGSLAVGIGAGFLFFIITHFGVNEGFEPVNPAATTDEIRPSQ